MKDVSRALAPALFGLILLFHFSAISYSQSHDLKTEVVFDKPVQVPGAVLQPNVKYVFCTLNSEGPEIVRVLNAEETHVIASFPAVQDARNAENTALLTFYDTTPGYPLTIRAWFSPGLPVGLRFLYPKPTGTAIAAHLVDGRTIDSPSSYSEFLSH